MIKIIIDSKYHREQYDDWLSGGKIEYGGKTYYWIAQDSNYGYGWEVEPISEKDWDDIPEEKFKKILGLIQSCLYEHRIEYIF